MTRPSGTVVARAAPPALVARGVVKRWPGGVVALDGVDLEVSAGETVALVGRSGCGKTTLLSCFNRRVEPDAGVVRVEGRPVAGEDPVALRRRLGYVPQNGGLLPHWTVAANVALVPGLLGWPQVRRRERARELLERVGLPPAEFGDRLPHQLSGGQRQRVAIARALAAEPRIVLLDEPFGALDALTRGELQREFAALAKRLGKAVLLVTHDLDEAYLLAHRIAVMDRGRILQAGPPTELEQRPASDEVARLIALRPGRLRGGGA